MPTLKAVGRMLQIATATALAMILAAPVASSAFQEDRYDDFDRDWWSDYYRIERERIRVERDRVQVERERIQSQEEQIREQGREKRRDELEQQQERKARDYRDYLGAKIEASRAAIRSPQGAFYRRPGTVTTDLPAAAQPLETAGAKYRYFSGVFYLQAGSRFIVVPAPVGAVVDTLPDMSTEIDTSGGKLHYYFGSFYAERGGKFEVVKPPAGVMVDYLPDGYEQMEVKGATVYRFGEVLFKPYLIQGFLAYLTVDG